MNAPVPVPLVVWVPVIIGFVVVLQHTPRAVTVAPPSVLILPPPAAVVAVIEVTAVVVSVGIDVTPFGALISFWHEKRIIVINPKIIRVLFIWLNTSVSRFIRFMGGGLLVISSVQI